MAIDRRSSLKVLEKGDVFFLFRPNLDEFAPGGLIDIRRFYLVLHPEGSDLFRLIADGEKAAAG